MIQDGRGKRGLHPLTPSIRNRWELVPFHMPKTRNQPSEQPAPPEVATLQENHQEAGVSEEENPEYQQLEETAE